jgi:hypothetical protein
MISEEYEDILQSKMRIVVISNTKSIFFIFCKIKRQATLYLPAFDYDLLFITQNS